MIVIIFSSDMVEILDKDRTDEEALSYALDTLSNICSPEEFEEEIVDSRPVQDMSRPRFGFCVLNFLSILSDFISREKLTQK